MHGDGCITYGKCVGLKLLKKKDGNKELYNEDTY